MLQTALKPRFLAFLALAIAVAIAFTMLGLWQMNVARDKAVQETLDQARSQPVVPVQDLLQPRTTLVEGQPDRLVSATGRYDGARQFLVTGRRLGDRVGYWIATPLVVDATNARLIVVRGFTTEAQAPPPPSTPVTVTGALAVPESPGERGVTLPPGQMQKIDLSILVNQWEGPLYHAFIFATAESPDLLAQTPSVTRVPPPHPEQGLNLRNVGYALQWWVFAAFGLYLWWRMVREEHLRAVGPAGPDAHTDDPHTDDPSSGGSHPCPTTSRS